MTFEVVTVREDRLAILNAIAEAAKRVSRARLRKRTTNFSKDSLITERAAMHHLNHVLKQLHNLDNGLR